MFQNTRLEHIRFLRLVICHVAVFGALLLFQPVLRGQTFKPATYQADSKTAGIQEAIDAAAKAGGGTVQIPAGTFMLLGAAGRPPILLKSRVTLIGAGPDKTTLKLGAKLRVPAVMANEHYADPDAEADHDITLEGFTMDAAATEQVLRETQLARAIPVAGEQELALASLDGVAVDSLIRVDPGPNEEIVPVFKSSSGFKALFLRTHPAGTRVVQLLDRLHGLALVGVHNATIQNVTIQNVPMDGIYLSNTISPEQHSTYCEKINIEKSKFIGCHRNGISVIDADDVTIANNEFREITGDPGSPVDIEPNHPEQHGNRIVIRDNDAFRCFRGISLSLQFSGPASANFQGESVTGNFVRGTLYGWGVYVLMQRAGATISGNTIEDPAAEGILVVGSSGVQVTNNTIKDPGRCHTPGNCNRPAAGVGIRLAEYGPQPLSNDNAVTGNSIKDDQQAPSLLYGVDFSSKGKGNSIQRNVVSRFDAAHGQVVHVSGNADSNTISGNTKQ